MNQERPEICPYYHADGPSFIRCAGAIPDTTARIDFSTEDRKPDPDAKTLHHKLFCCNRWKYCEQAAAVRYIREETEPSDARGTPRR